jgi:hypothetical protein
MTEKRVVQEHEKAPTIIAEGGAFLLPRPSQKLLQAPRLGSQSSLHRWRLPDRWMDPAEIVVAEQQAESSFMVFPFLAVGVCQLGQSAYYHPDGEIRPLNVRRTNLIFIRIADSRSSDNVDYSRGEYRLASSRSSLMP